MRVAIVGGGGLATTCARVLIESGCEVVLIEKDADRIAALETVLDCGLIHGDGTKPGILREADPERCAALLCLSGSDHDNLLASVVGRHLGFPRTIPKIEDAEFEAICSELGLGDAIIPDQTTARALVDILHGRTVPELAALGTQVRLQRLAVGDAVAVEELELPKRTVVLGVSRADRFVFPDDLNGGKLAGGDELIVLTHVDNVEGLGKRFAPKDG
jgi:trk system potassium uptake protein TrkA